ncbi:MAG: glycoside hydrolase family 3 C-terminal domain-containing protein [Polyangiaceae bacterium]|nr:glycoside hydrolase family 3 C-terminal domain-containing protein [Polyangiaceae bacterium]
MSRSVVLSLTLFATVCALGCTGRDEPLAYGSGAWPPGGGAGGRSGATGAASGEGGAVGDPDETGAMEGVVSDLLAELTLEEKLAMVAGTGFDTIGAPRLAIPALHMTDGPVGIRTAEATAWPAGIAMAATFDPELAERWGRALGREAKARGRNVLLGPCVNIQRAPQGGRNFESFGEDPFLASRMTVAVVRGVQAEGVVATVKHFAANNQETDRFAVSVEVEPRTLHEIYFPAFEAAVKEARAQGVMCSYNRVNGVYACENPYLLQDTLRDRWGFTGLVMSDWGAAHGVETAIHAGLDLEMPEGVHYSPGNLAAALEAETIVEADLDVMVRRQLRVITRMGLLEGPLDPGGLDTAAHRALNREAVRSSFVLLKNEGGVLPLARGSVTRLAVLGPLAAVVEAGGGSSLVSPTYEVSLLDALRARLPEVTVGETVGDAVGADAAIVVVGHTSLQESEGFDRAALDLPPVDLDLIRAVAAVNLRTIVLVATGSPVLLGGFLGEVPAVMQIWFGGQELGNGLVDVLFGGPGPSGRLPMTIPRRWEDCPAHGHFPGADGVVAYSEGLFVGYRGFDAKGIEPEFPFGFGLSYTSFEYRALEVGTATEDGDVPVIVEVANIGQRYGVVVPELYVRHLEASLPRPDQVLAGFARAGLSPGDSRRVELVVPARSLEVFEPAADGWVREGQRFELCVGESSRDIRLRRSFELP